jgi:hypothetical protein
MSEYGSQHGSLARGDDHDSGHDDGRTDGYGRTDGDEPRSIELSSVPFDVTPAAGDDGDDGDSRTKAPSRTGRIVLGSLLAVGLAGAAVVGTAGWRIASQKDATLTVPQTVTGLQLNNTDDAATTAEYLRTALTAEVELDKSVGAVYTDSTGAERSVLFFGGTGLIWTPERDLETALDLVKDSAGAVTGLHDVSAGELGGTMKCGATDDATGAITVCGWADHGSLALAMFPNRSADEAGPLLRTIREAAQTRG